MHISGMMSVGEKCCATEASVSGGLSVKGDFSAEKIRLSGQSDIRGLLNAEEVEIILQKGCGCSQIGSVGGGSVKVAHQMSGGFNLLSLFRSKSAGGLKTSSIEADKVELEYTEAETVRAIDAVIGKGCKIGTVEYSGTLTVDEDAIVGNIVKTE